MKKAFLLLSLLTTGCVVGPNYRRPSAPAPPSYTRPNVAVPAASKDLPLGEAQSLTYGKDIPHAWWTLFQSKPLNTLVEQSLQSNPSIAAAQHALRQASELVLAQRGLFFPTVQASTIPSYQRQSASVAPFLNSNDLRYSFYSHQLSVGYTPDVFGGNRRQVQSLQAQVENQRFQLEATHLTLTANVVAAAIQEASLRAQIDATRDLIAISSRSLDLVRRQFQFGAVSGLEVSAQETGLAQVMQTLPPLRKQQELNRNLLIALTGRLPAENIDQVFDLASFHLPEDLPLSLPSKLIEQRPDVRAAESQVKAASALIGVSVANRLPQFTITAALGGSAANFLKPFVDGNPFWGVIGGVSQTIWDARTLRHRQRAAEEAYQQAVAQHKSTVIVAFQNVADSLYALQSDSESLKASSAVELAAKRTLEITLKQQEFGAVNYLALLNAQQAYQQAVIARVQSQANRLSDTAALFQALGGGWWNRP